MNYIKNIEKSCAVCKYNHHYQKIALTNNIGMRDLDTRIPGSMRNMIHLSLEKCPNCGYVNNDVSILIDHFDKSEINNDIYQNVLKSDLNFSIKKFVLFALLQKTRNYKTTGMSFLKAAWMADDAKKSNEAKILRSKAIKYLELTDDEDKENIHLIIVDLYRRIGMFDEAIDYAKYLLNNFGMEKYKQNILFYQIKLSQDQDVLDHTIPGNYNFLIERDNNE